MNNIKEKNSKNIKKNRVKSYFVSAAKEIVIAEGAQNVSVRKIADKSGYSYGSIYNYYADLNELMQDVRNLMYLDLFNIMGTYLEYEKYEIADIKNIYHKLADYFIDNINIYHFFYTYIVKETKPVAYEEMDMGQMYWNTYKDLADNGIIKSEDVPVIAKTMVYCLYGLLSLYFSSNGITVDKLHEDLDRSIDYILKG